MTKSATLPEITKHQIYNGVAQELTFEKAKAIEEREDRSIYHMGPLPGEFNYNALVKGELEKAYREKAKTNPLLSRALEGGVRLPRELDRLIDIHVNSRPLSEEDKKNSRYMGEILSQTGVTGTNLGELEHAAAGGFAGLTLLGLGCWIGPAAMENNPKSFSRRWFLGTAAPALALGAFGGYKWGDNQVNYAIEKGKDRIKLVQSGVDFASHDTSHIRASSLIILDQ